ncbi:hypothetical protein ACFXTH_001873 [Malus domestica]
MTRGIVERLPHINIAALLVAVVLLFEIIVLFSGRVQELVQAIQMSGFHISLPAPYLAPPSTSEPPRPADT